MWAKYFADSATLSGEHNVFSFVQLVFKLSSPNCAPTVARIQPVPSTRFDCCPHGMLLALRSAAPRAVFTGMAHNNNNYY